MSDQIDPKLLANLSESERAEALAAAAAAKRAEERAEQRAIERALERKRLERLQEKEREREIERERLKKRGLGNADDDVVDGGGGKGSHEKGSNRLKFVPKKRRGAGNNGNNSNGASTASHGIGTSSKEKVRNNHTTGHESNSRTNPNRNLKHHLSEAEMKAIKKTYLGESAVQDEAAKQRDLKRQKKPRQTKKNTFKFEWDATDDTSNVNNRDDIPMMIPLAKNRRNRRRRNEEEEDARAKFSSRDNNVMTKPIHKMTPRDWRIFKENYDISVKGGKAPPPLRNFRESSTPTVPPIHPTLVQAIEKVMKYKEPSPIQRQAIPIGLQRRDLIGIAETGSGKTAAFGIPLCHHVLSISQKILDTVTEEGPLALVMAPTRELAQQIEAEFTRLLSLQSNIKTTCIVGGQAIQQQAMTLRQGVHIVVGTPGRINDCIENAYLVLNQCSYIVLDEADR